MRKHVAKFFFKKFRCKLWLKREDKHRDDYDDYQPCIDMMVEWCYNYRGVSQFVVMD